MWRRRPGSDRASASDVVVVGEKLVSRAGCGMPERWRKVLAQAVSLGHAFSFTHFLLLG